ncbi:hypothetical protein ACJBRD_10085, partial [Streptococcus suis]
IISALLLQQQLAHLQSLPIGFAKEGKLIVSDIDAGDIFYVKNNMLLDQINGIDGVKQASVIDISLTGNYNSYRMFTADN